MGWACVHVTYRSQNLPQQFNVLQYITLKNSVVLQSYTEGACLIDSDWREERTVGWGCVETVIHEINIHCMQCSPAPPIMTTVQCSMVLRKRTLICSIAVLGYSISSKV